MSSSGPASYHATVSKMARKYSHHSLPHPSQLLDESEDVTSVDGSQPGLDVAEEKERVFTPPPMAVIPSVAEVDDEVVPPGALTMPSHQSPSLRPARSKQVHFSPIDEIRGLQMDRDFFMDIFDKYFVSDNEDDVDLEEFRKSLGRLSAPLSVDQAERLFGVMVSDGSGASDGYLDREQFADFLSRKYEAPQLVALHSVLLQAILQNAKRNDERRSVMVAEEADRWDAAEVTLQEVEMRHAMEQMVDTEMEKIRAKQVAISLSPFNAIDFLFFHLFAVNGHWCCSRMCRLRCFMVILCLLLQSELRFLSLSLTL